ncbi:MAG: zinc-dependent peptidase [Cyclobacteriaceae bacterium]
MGAALLAALARLLYGGYQELRFRFYYGPIFHRFLNRKYIFYTTLPWALKMKFLRLARDQYEYFEFVPRERLKLTRAMKAIISCAAAQLLLFLPSKGLSFYKRIIVYPDYYNSRITHRRHKGEVNPGLRTIVFSWRGIAEGLKLESDGINLLLHEFAHALWLEHKLVDHYEILDTEYVTQFEKYAATEMANLAANEQHFFRRYAFDNMEEFFAVAVENFFERPALFQQAQPELYLILVRLFKQDPVKLYAFRAQQKPLFR